MQRSIQLGALCAILMVQTGCGEPPPMDEAPPAQPTNEPAPTREMFFGLPVVPGSRIVAGGSDVAEARIQVPIPADSLARVYRRILAKQAWDIRGDATAPDGSVTLHARSSEGRPIWIMIRPLTAGQSEVSLIATAVDSTAAAPR